MNYNITTAVEPDFVRVTAAGKYSFEALFGFIDLVKSESERCDRTRVLIDCLNLEGKMTEVERFEGGQRIAEVFRPRLKAALLMPPDGITKLGELTAVNRGARFLVTSSESEALDWLLTGS